MKMSTFKPKKYADYLIQVFENDAEEIEKAISKLLYINQFNTLPNHLYNEEIDVGVLYRISLLCQAFYKDPENSGYYEENKAE